MEESTIITDHILKRFYFFRGLQFTISRTPNAIIYNLFSTLKRLAKLALEFLFNNMTWGLQVSGTTLAAHAWSVCIILLSDIRLNLYFYTRNIYL